MSRTLQFKRYSNTYIASSVTGANGEIIVDGTNSTLTVHDGVTLGGTRLATENWVRTNETSAALGQASFNAANTAAANTVYLSGVNLTQNNSIATLNANVASINVNIGTINSSLTNINNQTNNNLSSINTINGTLTVIQGINDVQNTAINTANTFKTFVAANNGFYSSNNYTGTYSDGIIMDYVTGNGRISVGPADQITFYTGGPATTPVANLYSNATFTTVNVSTSGLITTTGNGIGYATGSGGVVTQITNRTTGVTLNKPSGQITLFSQAMATTTANTFVLTNSTISANDFVLINHWSGGTLGNYVFAANTSAGQANITIRSISTVAAEAPVLQYVVIKGAAS